MTALTLRSELLRGRLRTGATDVAAADAELAEIAVPRQAASDIRTVAATPLRTSIADEIRQARALLDAAGVTTTFDVDLPRLPTAADSAGPILRECVTNVLRHGGRRRCATKAIC